MQARCHVQKNLERCSCTYEPCPRKGLCCQCLEYHWSAGELPGCLFPPEAERTYDRSIEAFIRVWAEKKGYKLVKA